MAATRMTTDLWSMKTLRLFSLVGITSIALAHAGWAAGRGGGGGGGGGFGGGGFGGGHFGGGGVARGSSPGFGGPRFSLPVGHFSNIRPGHSFSSFGMHQSGIRPNVSAGPNPAFTAQSARAATTSNRRPDRGTTNRLVPSNIARNGGAMSPAARPSSQAFSQRGLNGRTDHISERHEASWHGNWNQRHAHFHHGHFFVFDDGFWFGLDDGFFPWDYLPYYADDYYPYDYYTEAQPDDSTVPVNNGAPVPDPTVQSVQTRLSELRYYGGPVDGIFGPTTRDAVARYQMANQLDVTGSLSPDMLQSLGLPQGTSS